jgi:hypothetical protein
MTSTTGSVLNFLLFVAIVALGATAYYAHGQATMLEAYRKANAVLAAERDSLAAKNSELAAAAKAADVKLRESAARLAERQEEVATTARAPARRR